MRETPPDILLTNYKMLDQLLLRQQDQPIWAKSATSLTYLVLDEFHTYDGAQGTDVAMLLRRLGIALKSHWPDDDPPITDEDRPARSGASPRSPRRRRSATRATPDDARLRAHRLRRGLRADSVVTESRLTLDEWVGDAGTASHRSG